MKAHKEIHFWECRDCGIYARAISLHDARVALERHEKELHKKKPIGCFGTSVCENKFV